jgi:hypothetical protein
MIDIIIKKNVHDAICWASEQFEPSEFSIQHSWPSDRWCFSFRQQKQASLFALMWAS